jgi:hypothetical protein
MSRRSTEIAVVALLLGALMSGCTQEPLTCPDPVRLDPCTDKETCGSVPEVDPQEAFHARSRASAG